jgi:hypothetical protein
MPIKSFYMDDLQDHLSDLSGKLYQDCGFQYGKRHQESRNREHVMEAYTGIEDSEALIEISKGQQQG